MMEENMKRISTQTKFLIFGFIAIMILIVAIGSVPVVDSEAGSVDSNRVAKDANSGVVAQVNQPPGQAAVDRLVIEAGGEASVTVSSATGYANFVRLNAGNSLAPESAIGLNAQDTAQAFLTQYGDAFGIADASKELVYDSSLVDNLGRTRVTYRQTHEGVAVFAGILHVHLNQANEIVAANGDFIPNIKINPSPTLTAKQASTIALDAVLGQNGLVNASNDLAVVGQMLYIYNDGLLQGNAGTNHLVYEVEVANSANTIREFVYVNAHTGAIVNQITGIHEALDRKVYESNLGNPIWEDSQSDPDPIPAGWAGGSTQQVTDWQNEIDAAAETYNVFASMTAGTYLSYDGADASMLTVNNDPSINCPNANWNGTSTNYCSGVTGDDTVAHEWGHAYTEKTSNLIYQWQSGALNESYSDIWGEVIDLLNGRGLDTPGALRTAGSCSTLGQGSPANDTSYRWLSGEDDPAFGGAIRDLWNPTCYGDPGKVFDTSQYVCSTFDSGGVHTNSGVPNHAFALMVDGGTYNGQTITGLGLTKSAHIHWRAQSVYLTAASNFTAQADALETSCNDLIGVDLNALSTTSTNAGSSGEMITAADCSEVAEISLAVQFRSEPTFCNFTTLLNPNAPALCSAGQTVNTILLQDWESGLGSWTVGTRNVANPATFDTPNWAAVGNLPSGAPAGSTQAAFVADLIIGDCNTDDETGALFLDSPVFTIPAGAPAKLAFDHWVATEVGWDGGNLKASINGGPFNLVGAANYTFNPYNQNLNTIGAGNTNPLAGQAAFTGTDGGTVNGSWGQSQVNLAAIASAGSTVKLRYDFGVDGCNGVIGWYVDNVHAYSCTTGGPTATPTSTATPAGPTATPTSTPTPGATNTPLPTATPGTGSTFVFNPVADSVVRSSSGNTNFGTKTIIGIDDVPDTNSYLRFDVQGLDGPITSAILELTVNTGNTPFNVHKVTSTTWGELTVTYNNAPPISTLVNGSGAVSPGTVVAVNVTSYVNNSGLFSMALDAVGTGSTFFSSREGANPPRLVITTGGAGPTPTNTPTGPTATPTMAPPTATPGANALHAGDLDGSSTQDRPTQTWAANVEIEVQNVTHGKVVGATVTGSWSTGATASCTTNASGRCTVSLSSLPKTTNSVSFTISNITNGVDPYDALANHDPDGDSNGTTITVFR
jgi:Zn-dependent metalloprotease